MFDYVFQLMFESGSCFNQSAQPHRNVSSDSFNPEISLIEEEPVSFQSELPVTLQASMVRFIEKHPNWDQYRLVSAALAGFLVQNGLESRSITRLYVGNMFNLDSFKVS